MINHVFILVPSFTPAGPVKGAVALGNALANVRSVTLVCLKGGNGFNAPINEKIELVDLSKQGSLLKRIAKYRELLRKAGSRSEIASISFTFSADMTNYFCRKNAVTCASVRGNLIKNYKMEYGVLGILLAVFHLALLRYFKVVVVMTGAMSSQVFNFTWRVPITIPNFIDESPLDKYRKNTIHTWAIRFVFVGSLTSRKQPLLLVKALKELLTEGNEVYLDIIGDGPLYSSLKQLIKELKLEDKVILHGHMANPYSVVASAHIFVLPSLSEGVSRASLEALYIGLPCIMRNIDGNNELIENGKNGFLFDRDDQLSDVMRKAIELAKELGSSRKSLLPEIFRQEKAAPQYLMAVESK